MTDTLRTGLAAKFSLTAVSRAAIGGLLGAALLAAGAPARAADDGVPLDTKIIRGIMESLGLREDGTSINYSERAPLVIPPTHTLPPPERSDAALVNNPAWPVDPDVKRGEAGSGARAQSQHESGRDDSGRGEPAAAGSNRAGTEAALEADRRRRLPGVGERFGRSAFAFGTRYQERPVQQDVRQRRAGTPAASPGSRRARL